MKKEWICNKDDHAFYNYLVKHPQLNSVRTISDSTGLRREDIHKKINRLKKLRLVEDEYDRKIRVKKILFLP